MHLLNQENLADYLHGQGVLPNGEDVEVLELTGGVSNAVFRVLRTAHDDDLVVKQGGGQLRTKDPWYCSVERIWREIDVLDICSQVLARLQASSSRSGTAHHQSGLQFATPRVLFRDPQQYVFAMTAAPRQHSVWKERLLKGETDSHVATACGEMLGQLHGLTWHDSVVQQRLADRLLFDALRLDPYYRAAMRAHPDLAKHFDELIFQSGHELHCLVHADFSPKNLLLWPGNMLLVDFETGHFGDPAFDLGFFLTHLLLKAHWAGPQQDQYYNLIRSFWRAYSATMSERIPPDDLVALEARAVGHWAGCTLARLDGKSKIEYLTDHDTQDNVRRLARQTFQLRPRRIEDVLQFSSR